MIVVDVLRRFASVATTALIYVTTVIGRYMVDDRDTIPSTGKNGWEVKFVKTSTALRSESIRTYVPGDSLGMHNTIMQALVNGCHVYINDFEVIADGVTYKYLADF